MRHHRRSAVLLAATATALVPVLSPLGTATAAPGADSAGQAATVAPSGTADTREFTPSSKKPAVGGSGSAAAARQARADDGPPQVGDARTWLANDDIEGPYLKRYVLRGVGDNVQVWVANDRAFPTNDCRNDLGLTEITNKQVKTFISEFSDTMYPRESRVFSVPPERNGSQSVADQLGLPADYWRVPARQADDIVVLVDNVRDTNYYDPASEDGQTFIAGFFWSYFNELADRNIMSIDAYDWIHRTGPNPPDDSQDPDYQACADELNQPYDRFGISRPEDYEGTFAHEYQHLLEYYEDSDETSWVNEGISDWAQTLTGYTDPRIDVARKGADSHMACFAGFSGRRFGGPENSLTQWSDQGGPEILCDYGAAYSFMEYLQSHYGDRIMTKLHRINANGFAGLERALDAVGVKADAEDVLHRWAAMVAIDKALDRNGGDLRGGKAGLYSADSLRYHLKWGSPEAYSEPGAPANGSDYVRLRDGADEWLSAGDVSSITFDGEETAFTTPVEWTLDETAPDSIGADDDCNTPPAAGTGTALYSGCGDDFDRSIAREVSVPADDPTLSFESLWDIEVGWDFGVVQVSDDGGQTWTSLETEDTTTEADPDADPRITDELPGLTDSSDGWQTQTANLSDWAGEDVIIAFRYLTDAAVSESGWWVRDISVGGTAIPTTLDGWQTQNQISPDPVDDWNVQLVAYGAKGDPVWRHTMRLDDAYDATLEGSALRDAIGSGATTVAAIVMQDDPDENARYYAGYRLLVNGVLQPGGGIDECGNAGRC